MQNSQVTISKSYREGRERCLIIYDVLQRKEREREREREREQIKRKKNEVRRDQEEDEDEEIISVRSSPSVDGKYREKGFDSLVSIR